MPPRPYTPSLLRLRRRCLIDLTHMIAMTAQAPCAIAVTIVSMTDPSPAGATLALKPPAVRSEQSVTQQRPLCVTSSRDVCIDLFPLATIVPSINAIRTLNVDLQMSVVVDQQQKSVNLLSEGTSMSQRSPPPPPLRIGRLGRGFSCGQSFPRPKPFVKHLSHVVMPFVRLPVDPCHANQVAILAQSR